MVEHVIWRRTSDIHKADDPTALVESELEAIERAPAVLVTKSWTAPFLDQPESGEKHLEHLQKEENSTVDTANVQKKDTMTSSTQTTAEAASEALKILKAHGSDIPTDVLDQLAQVAVGNSDDVQVIQKLQKAETEIGTATSQGRQDLREALKKARAGFEQRYLEAMSPNAAASFQRSRKRLDF